MSDEKKDQFFDLDRSVQQHICCLCECNDIIAHACYWKCPIFEGNTICAECCLVDALRPGVEAKFSEKLGRPITREEINKMCGDCGRNHATEDNDLADRIQNNTITPPSSPPPTEKDPQ